MALTHAMRELSGLELAVIWKKTTSNMRDFRKALFWMGSYLTRRALRAPKPSMEVEYSD